MVLHIRKFSELAVIENWVLTERTELVISSAACLVFGSLVVGEVSWPNSTLL